MSPRTHSLAHRLLKADALRSSALAAAIVALAGWVSYFLLGMPGLIGGAALLALTGIATANGELVLRLSRARPLGEHAARELTLIVSTLSHRVGIAAPRLYWLPSPVPNAMAVETRDARGALALSAGLLQRLDPDELEAVVAHEISHLRHGDTRLKRWTVAAAQSALALVRAAVLLGFVSTWITGEGLGSWLLLVLLSWTLPLLFGVLHSAISRSREFAADTSAATLTGRPEALASALSKLESANLSLWSRLFGLHRRSGWLDSHPATQERIERLLALSDTPRRRNIQARIRPTYGREQRGPWGASRAPVQVIVTPRRH